MSRRRHPVVHLPPLQPDQALDFADLLERIIEALWAAHGYDMALRGTDRALNVAPAEDPRLPRSRPTLLPHDDLPF